MLFSKIEFLCPLLSDKMGGVISQICRMILQSLVEKNALTYHGAVCLLQNIFEYTHSFRRNKSNSFLLALEPALAMVQFGNS